MHPHGSLQVKSQIFYDLLKANFLTMIGDTQTKCQSVMTGHHVDTQADADSHETLYVLPIFGERTDVVRSNRNGQA